MTTILNLEQPALICSTETDYDICIARLKENGRWIGYAVSPDPERTIFILPEIADGPRLGVHNRDLAIRMATVIANENEYLYGTVKKWFVHTRKRGNSAEFRCEVCGELFCEGDHDLIVFF